MEVCAETGSGLGKWLGFVTAVWVQCFSGTNDAYTLKSLIWLTQLELNNLSVAMEVGKFFGLLAGLAYDRLPIPHIMLLIGALEGLIGYGAQWLVVSQSISPLPYWTMWVFLCMGSNSTTWMNTAVLVTCMRNFKWKRGSVSEILTGYEGLSTSIFTELCSALFADDPASFLLMLAVVPAVVCSAAMLFLHESPASAGDDETDTKCFRAINAMATAIAVCLFVLDLTGHHGTAVSRAFVAMLLVLLAAPAAVPIYVAFKARSKNPDVEGQIQEPLLNKEVKEEQASTSVAAEENGKRRPAIGEDHTIFEAAMTVDFWILFISLLLGVGVGVGVGTGVERRSKGASKKLRSRTRIWRSFGRTGSGWICRIFKCNRLLKLKETATPETSAVPRPVRNAIAEVLMAVGCVVMALALPGSLYVGTTVVGLSLGVRDAVTVATASELFGLKYLGLFYNILELGHPLGSFSSDLLAGLLYDSQATEMAGVGNTSVGAHCYGHAFVIMAFACFVGFELDAWLALRTREVYSKIQHAKKKAGKRQRTNKRENR